MSQVKAVICSKYPDTKDETGMKHWYLWNFKYVFLTQRQSVRHYHKSKQKPLLALFAQIMVALYNENLFPTDIIIFFLKSNQNVYIVGLGLTFFLLAILPARHDWHTSLYQASLFFYTVASIIRKWNDAIIHIINPLIPIYKQGLLKKRGEIMSMSDSGLRNIQLGARPRFYKYLIVIYKLLCWKSI